MERAVPLTERMAASTSKQFRSGILIFAISSTCAWVILPTLALCGSAEPLAIPTARLISTGTGRRLGDEGERTIREDGDHHRDDETFLIFTRSFCVERLAELHDVDALRTERRTDRGRRSGLARGNLQLYRTCYFLCHFKPFNLFYLISGGSGALFDLQEVQLHRSGTTENRDQHAQGVALRIDFVHFALEVGKGSIDDANRFVLLEVHLRTRPFGCGRLTIEHLVDFIRAERHGSLSAADETGDARSIFHAMPEFIVHIHLDDDVAGIEQTLAGDFFAVAEFDDFFFGDENLTDLLTKTESVGAGAERFGYFAFKAGIGVDDVPLLGFEGERRFCFSSFGFLVASTSATASSVGACSFVVGFLRLALRTRVLLRALRA